METPFFFNNRNQKRLFGILHSADTHDDAIRKNIAVIYCHPLFEEYQLSHRVSVNFARYLTAHDCSVLRFNYFGDGESDGLFEEASVESRVGDIKTAIAEIQSRLKPEKIFLLGLRTGATLALLAAENCKEIDGLICWSPILNMGEFVYNLLRENMSTQIAVHKKVIYNREKMIEQINQGSLIDIKGYNLGNPFYKQALEIDFTKRTFSNSMPSLFVQISNVNKIEKQLEEFKTANESLDLTIKVLNEQKMWVPQKMVFPPYNDLYSTTLSWIKEKASI
jgi:uncharacterized protein